MIDALGIIQFALMVEDWKQTRDLSSRPPQVTFSNGLETVKTWTESNPILGARPDAGRINRDFIATESMVWLAAGLLPEWRTTILGASAIIETSFILHNASIGIRITLP